MQLKSVSKSWKTLISMLLLPLLSTLTLPPSSFTPIGVHCGTFSNNLELRKDKLYSYDDSSPVEYNDYIVGSYNELVCFYCRKVIGAYPCYSEYWLNFRNLALGTISEKLGYFLDSEKPFYCSFNFSFGYDNSTETYKALAFRLLRQEYNSQQPSWTSEVKVFNLGDYSWRNIQSFPVLPLYFAHSFGVHLIGTINWFALTNASGALHGWTHIDAESLVILSLGLSTETYTQLLLPKCLNDHLHVEPTLRVLGNCLCFSHDFKGTEFVIWRRREFGVRESWAQLIKVSYQTLQMQNLPMGDHIYGVKLVPLYLSKNSDTLIFASLGDNRAVIYNRKDDRVERTRFFEEIDWLSSMNYVESLVPIT